MQIGISVVAVVVKTEHLALTVVVTLCQCREMDVMEEQCVAIKFCCKVNFSATKTVELIQKAYGDAALSPPARQCPGAFGRKNSTVSDSKTSRNIEPPPYPNYFLFPKVKLQLKGARFDKIEEIQKAVTNQLHKIPA